MNDSLSTSPSQSSPLRRHMDGLDGLRGVAIVMVMGTHLLHPNTAAGGAVHMWMRALADSLWMGVDLFFVLSGFLITGILLDSLASSHYFRNFYMRRVLRIFPLYYTVLLVFIVCAPWLHIVWGKQLVTLLTYTNRIFINPSQPGFHFYFGGHNNLVNFWSLAVEEQFYFVWPLLVFLVKKPQKLIPLTAALMLATIATRFYLVSRNTAPDVIYVSLACRADALLMGALLAAGMRHGYRTVILRAAKMFAAAGAVAAVVVLIAMHGIKRDAPYMMEYGYTFGALFFAALVALAVQPAGWSARWCTAAWLRFLGRYSYGLYILHSVLPAFYGNWLPGVMLKLTRNQTGANAALVVMELVIALGTAMLSYHFLEQPFLRLKKYFPSFTPRPKKSEAVLAEPALALIAEPDGARRG